VRVFVTGIGGFLGRHVALALMEAGHAVAGCDNFLTSAEPESLPFPVGRYSVQEVQAFPGRLTDLVVHCAAIPRSTWPNDEELWEHNVVATKAVLDWGLPVIFASSSTAANPTNTYGTTKLTAERLVLGRGGTALRFSNIYGPGQSEDQSVTTANVLAAFRAQRANLGRVIVEGDGTKTRHWVHVTDAARAVVAAVDRPQPGMWLDICGERASIRRMASAFGCPIRYVPNRPNDPQDMPQDNRPAKYLLGWEPKVSLWEGLAEVVRA
jgi:UDP-glucose 4-epimerase